MINIRKLVADAIREGSLQDLPLEVTKLTNFANIVAQVKREIELLGAAIDRKESPPGPFDSFHHQGSEMSVISPDPADVNCPDPLQPWGW